MFRRLYDGYCNMDRKILTLEIVIYTALLISFCYSFYVELGYILAKGFSGEVIPFAVSTILILIFFPQLILMILVKMNVYPFKDETYSKPKKKQVKKTKKKNFKNKDIVDASDRFTKAE